MMKFFYVFTAVLGFLMLIGAYGQVMGAYEKGIDLFQPFLMEVILIGIIGLVMAIFSIQKLKKNP